MNEVSRSSNVKSSGDESQNIQIEQLKKRIREVDAEINRIAKSNENKERETKSFDKYLSKNTSFLQNKSSNSIQKIVRDISDLKSFINVNY